MNILVFGSSGFLGRALLKFLVEDKTISQITVAIHKTKLPEYLQSKKIKEIPIDKIFEEEYNNNGIYDVVISLTGKNLATATATATATANLAVPKEIIDFCKKNDAKHFIFASSINTRISESKSYAEYKRQIEAYLAESGVPYTIIRPAVIFGKGDTGLSKIYNFIKKFPFIPVFGNGMKLEQPIHIEEAAEFFYRAALESPENKIYEIGGLKAYSYNDLMKAVADVIGKKIFLLHLPARPFIVFLRFLENLNLLLPVNSEQILHIDTDLDIDNNAALKKFNVQLFSFKERLDY